MNERENEVRIYHFYAVQQKEPGRERWVEGILQIETEFDFSIAGAMQEIRRRVAEKDEELDPKELQVQSLTLIADLTPTMHTQQIARLHAEIKALDKTNAGKLHAELERVASDYAYLQKQVTDKSLQNWLAMRETNIRFKLENTTTEETAT